MVFGFFSRNVVPDEEKKIWNNDARPSYETTRARFKIRDFVYTNAYEMEMYQS